jgi:hypothetical protein
VAACLGSTGAGVLTGLGQIALRRLSSGNGIDTTAAIWFHAGRLPALRRSRESFNSAMARHFLQVPVPEEYHKYQRTNSAMIPSSKCRLRNSAGRFLVKVPPCQIGLRCLQQIRYHRYYSFFGTGTFVLVVKQSQLDALAAAAENSFKQKLLRHIERSFPSEFAALGAPNIRQVIEAGIARARQYGLTGKRQICGFIDLMFIYGPHFDCDPRFPWAGRMLQDPTLPQEVKHAQLLDAARLHLNRASARLRRPGSDA